jgi:hypothetical protein
VKDYQLELQRRNARLRAFRAYGIPVEGGWSGIRFSARCATCNQGVARDLPSARPFAYLKKLGIPPERLRTVEATEGEVIAELVLRGCPHLSPLLDPEPKEVLAIWELELLSG